MVRSFTWTFLVVFLAAPATAFAASSPIELVEFGFKLSPSKVEALESRVASNPNDEEARLILLGYYATIPASVPADTIKRHRAEHIFWLIENRPKSELFWYVGATWKIFREGDVLADPDAFEQGKMHWLRQVKLHPADEKIKQNAATFLEFGDPETAIRLIRGPKPDRTLGSTYACRLLGIVAEDYQTGDPSAVNESIRESEEGRRILAELRASRDPLFLGGAGFWLSVQGGKLYADGKTDWDYTKLSEELLRKARVLDRKTIDWYAVRTKLPARGERPPLVVPMSASEMKSSLKKTVAPVYPAAARASAIEGSVLLNVLVGADGKVVKALAEGGTPELTRSAISAVSGWEFEPPRREERPVLVKTNFVIEYKLQAGAVVY